MSRAGQGALTADPPSPPLHRRVPPPPPMLQACAHTPAPAPPGWTTPRKREPCSDLHAGLAVLPLAALQEGGGRRCARRGTGAGEWS